MSQKRPEQTNKLEEDRGISRLRSFLFLPLFTLLRGTGILRTSRVRSSRKFAPSTYGWHHVHTEQATSEGDTLYMSIFPTKILLATDGSREAKLAATTAADLAKGTGSELHVLYVGEAVNPYVEEVGLAGAEAGDFERQARDLLDAEAEGVRAAGGAVEQAHLSRGKVDHAVVTLAEEIGAGLIVLGSRGHGGIRRALMGSVSDAVVRHAHCPVLVVRELSEKFVVVDSPKRLSY